MQLVEVVLGVDPHNVNHGSRWAYLDREGNLQVNDVVEVNWGGTTTLGRVVKLGTRYYGPVKSVLRRVITRDWASEFRTAADVVENSYPQAARVLRSMADDPCLLEDVLDL